MPQFSPHSSAHVPERLPAIQELHLSNQDFQERLQRIAAARHPRPLAQGAESGVQVDAGKSGYLRIGAGGGIMALGLQILKTANESYDSLRVSHGIAVVVLIAVLGLVIGLTGIVIIVRASIKHFSAPASVSQYPVGTPRHARQPSKAAKVVFSLLGSVLGVISCLYLAVAAAAGLINTEQGRAVFVGGSLIAVLLAFVSLLFGLAGIFARGRGLLRVPVYFFCSWILTLVAFRTLRINLLEWEPFTAHFQ